MTQVEYARHRGVGKSAVSNWKKSGWLVMNGRKVEVGKSDAVVDSHVDPGRGRPRSHEDIDGSPIGDMPVSTDSAPAADTGIETAQAPPDDVPVDANGQMSMTFNQERVREVYERRIGQALKNALTAGELVPLEAAQSKLTETARSLRERIQAEFRNVAEQLAAETTTRGIMSTCETCIDTVFKDVSTDLRQSGEESE